ncbi:MAG TPA: hypothetical protein PLA50_20490 [Bacteroidia bacterium]|nr:hypothetical protein [Bacteroidia bacterium]
MPSFSTAFLLFFSVSMIVLLMILCLKTPDMWISGRRFVRQMIARRSRKGRMLADLEKLMAEARRLEGIYCFEAVESHHSPRSGRSGSGRGQAKSSASAGSCSSVSPFASMSAR